jgi:hypothetical protein
LKRLAEERFVPKTRKAVPYEFVLDTLSPLEPRTRPMFGCLAGHVAEKIVFSLQEKREPHADNGDWLATAREHHESLRREFPSMRSIRGLGKGVTGWQVLPADAPDFEDAALAACELVLARDPRIGKAPGDAACPLRAAVMTKLLKTNPPTRAAGGRCRAIARLRVLATRPPCSKR